MCFLYYATQPRVRQNNQTANFSPAVQTAASSLIGQYLFLEAESLMDVSRESVHDEPSDIRLTNQLSPQL